MSVEALHAHLTTGTTHVCHCWALVRQDGFELGFTDHDQEIRFEGKRFKPQSGLSARAIANTTGLSINNTEAIGVLSDSAITEKDIAAGRYDDAKVTVWLVQWDNTTARQIQFSGTIGEITRAAGGFEAELRGLTDALNRPQGRTYLKTCSAVLGDALCGFDLSDPAYTTDAQPAEIFEQRRFVFSNWSSFNDRWFQGGRLEVLSGDAAGLGDVIKSDIIDGGRRIITLWQALACQIQTRDRVRLTAGCDKGAAMCREKFSNFVNFQGFPDIPGNDWLTIQPSRSGNNTGFGHLRANL